jgi:hypothetical protein
VQLVKDDPVFKSNGTKPFRGGAEFHMLLLLKFLGTSGNDNSGIKEGIFLGLGSGTVLDYLARATKAVLKLKDTVITWLDAGERKEIACRIQAKYDFVNCVTARSCRLPSSQATKEKTSTTGKRRTL